MIDGDVTIWAQRLEQFRKGVRHNPVGDYSASRLGHPKLEIPKRGIEDRAHPETTHRSN
jgi:hypothetical protein